MDAAGKSARESLKILDSLHSQGSLHRGIAIEDGSIRIEDKYHDSASMPAGLDPSRNDNKILSVCKNLAKKSKNVILVSKDINMRVKASALDLEVEEYEAAKVDVSVIYNGYTEIEATTDLINKFYNEKELSSEGYEFFPNQFVLLKNSETRDSALSKFDAASGSLLPLYHLGKKPWGISGRNLEQKFALEMLLSEEIKLVTLIGQAGTGKTLLALAAGLEKVIEEKKYQKLVVMRPIVPMGKDIGYLPGSKEDKLSNWMQPITDNLEILFANRGKDSYSYIFDKGLIEVEALTYIRGRSLPNCYIIIDEAQNLTPHEIKTIITRAGDNTKIVFTGDPYQIDNGYLDEYSNGLSIVANRFMEQPIHGHITLTKGERSELATLGAQLL
jgi:PhoH-like ATPase